MKFNKDYVDRVSKSAYNAREKQILIEQISAVALIDNDIREIATARFYMSSRKYANKMTCILWIHCDNIYIAASGTASGYGYHKASAALQSAIDAALIELDESISGCGDSAMIDAMTDIAKAACPNASIIKVIDAHN